MLEGRQRVQEYICSCLGGMGARTSMNEFILERKETEEVQSASSGGRHALREGLFMEGGRWDWELRRHFPQEEGGTKGLPGRELDAQSW